MANYVGCNREDLRKDFKVDHLKVCEHKTTPEGVLGIYKPHFGDSLNRFYLYNK
jgi:hypothetical protein